MKKIITAAFSCLAMLACSSNDEQLDDTVFIPDDNDQNLPAYTEWGYNSFGAKYERTYFLASKAIVPCKIFSRNDSLHLLINGVRVSPEHSSTMSITVIFLCPQITVYNDLLVLHKATVDLSVDCTVKLMIDGSERTVQVEQGELNFKRVQLLKVDDIVNRIILSGTFGFMYSGANSFPETVSDGRFDFGITSREFFAY